MVKSVGWVERLIPKQSYPIGNRHRTNTPAIKDIFSETQYITKGMDIHETQNPRHPRKSAICGVLEETPQQKPQMRRAFRQ